MKKYISKSGKICLEPEEGYLLERNGYKYKKAYLGVNDREELYSEVIDEKYVPEVKLEDDTIDLRKPIQRPNRREVILISPSGKRFKLKVTDSGTLETEEI